MNDMNNMNGMNNNNEVYYDQNVYYRGEEPNPNKSKKGLAIASLVLGIVSIVCFCCGFGFVTAPLAIIFGIIALVKKEGGTAMSVVGIVLSAISIIVVAAVIALYWQPMSDYVRFIGEAQPVIEEYKESGELPDYLEKYNGEKYEEFWESGGFDDFDDFFEQFIVEFEAAQNGTSGGTTSRDDSDSSYDYDINDDLNVEFEVDLG